MQPPPPAKPSLRILAVSPVYWPCVGGGERLLGTILEQLVARGHQATVLTVDAARHPDMFRSKGAGLPQCDIHAGVHIRRFSPGGGFFGRAAGWLNGKPGVHNVLQSLSGGRSELITARPNPREFVWPLATARADVIIAANWWSTIPVLAAFIARSRRIPVVALPLLHIIRPWANRPVLSRALPLCTCTVGLTPSEAEHHRHLGARRATVIGGAIAPDWGQAADGAPLRRRLGLGAEPVIAFVGRQDEFKGAPTLVNAMRLVWRQRPDAVLLFAGQAAHRDDATRTALAALASDDRRRVVEVNDFSDAEAADVFAACDILAQPSIEESFGLVLIEAWMAGRPVIGASIPATCDMIADGDDGLIVPPGDPPALADAILKLVTAPALRARMGERGRAKVRARFTTPTMVDAWEELLVATARR